MNKKENFIGDDYIARAYVPFIHSELKNFLYDDFDFSYSRNGITYQINDLGYRGSSFSKNVDLLAMGCSNTLGEGLPQKYTWPELLRSENIKNIDVLAASGDSAQGQVIKFFQYVKHFGNPKNVVAVLPCYRLEFPLDGDKWQVSDTEKTYTYITKNKARITLPDPMDEHFEKYAAAPYDPNKILTKQIARYYTHTFLNILEIYCSQFNINLKYSIYDQDYRFDTKEHRTLKQYMLNYSNNYFAWDYPYYQSDINYEELSLKCHSELNIDKYFYRAADYIQGKSAGHWGLHQNIHIAESIQNKLV